MTQTFQVVHLNMVIQLQMFGIGVQVPVARQIAWLGVICQGPAGSPSNRIRLPYDVSVVPLEAECPINPHIINIDGGYAGSIVALHLMRGNAGPVFDLTVIEPHYSCDSLRSSQQRN